MEISELIALIGAVKGLLLALGYCVYRCFKNRGDLMDVIKQEAVTIEREAKTIEELAKKISNDSKKEDK